MTFVIDKNLALLMLVVFIFVFGYFLSFQLQRVFAKGYNIIEKRLGSFTTRKEYAIQRYVYQHRGSLIARLYNWLNNQIIALGLKSMGVSPLGYLIFWSFVSLAIAFALALITNMNLFLSVFIWIALYVCLLIMTRVIVSERMEKRETDVMDAVDLIIPELSNGVKNAILRYQDNFPVSLRSEFKAFVSNIQDRGYTFEDAMYILADQLGAIFYDFAQKAIFYEASGESDMLDIFSDVTETNRLRRELRDTNTQLFNNLKVSFITSSFIVAGYFCFLMVTDGFSRYFFLQNIYGNILLIVIIIVIFGVMAYITTIKSRAI